jgi:DNA-binding transcriptional LysR family regulator
MLLRNLAYLDALAREEHFARAAAACNVTQPTLSAGIKQLEEELGLLLVQRGQRFQGLTPEGERMVHWARRVLADATSLQEEASELRGGLVGRLRIGSIPTVLPAMALVTAPFSERYPGVSITVLSLPSTEIQRGLDSFTLDAGLTYLDNEPLTGVRTVPLYHERYYLFTSDQGPLAEASSARWSDLASVPLCLLTPDMQNRRILDAQFAAAGISPRVGIETNSVLTLWAQVRSGRWSSVLPQPFLHLLGEPEGVRAVELEASSPAYTIGLVIPDREPLTPSARELARLVQEVSVAAILERGRSPIPPRAESRLADT